MDIYTLPDLPYDVSALEPHLSAETLELHHGKHHAAYVKGANETLERLTDADEDDITGLQRSLSFHVSGHVLHSLFWESMSPDMGQRPDGDLEAAIKEAFGTFDRYQERFNAALTTLQGSGWSLLAWEPVARRLMVVQVHDHDGSTVAGVTPILIADGWEHAYYVDYRNDKAAWAGGFSAVTNWKGAAEQFAAATA